MPVLKPKDAYRKFRFLFEIQGLIVGGFSEVSGLQPELTIENIENGCVNDYVNKLAKKAKFPNIILKRGIMDSDALWEWHQNVVNGKIGRKSGFIILLDSVGNEKCRWHFAEAYPVKWSGPELKADSNNVEVESLELVHEGISRA